MTKPRRVYPPGPDMVPISGVPIAPVVEDPNWTPLFPLNIPAQRNHGWRSQNAGPAQPIQRGGPALRAQQARPAQQIQRGGPAQRIQDTQQVPIQRTPIQQVASEVAPEASPKEKAWDWNLLRRFPDEILERVLVELNSIQRRKLISKVDVMTANAIDRNIFTANSSNVRTTQLVAVILEDVKLYKQGRFKDIRSNLLSHLDQAIHGAITTLTIFGSTCLFAADLEHLATYLKLGALPLLRNIEIMDSKTFSPIGLLHHCTQYTTLFTEPVTFELTGRHLRWTISNTSPLPQTCQLVVAFLYAYGAKLWKHFPSVFVKNTNLGEYYNMFGQWLNYNTSGKFFKPEGQALVKRCEALCEARTGPTYEYGSSDYGDYVDVPTWKEMSTAGKGFTEFFADKSLPGMLNPGHSGKAHPCSHCDLVLPGMCFTKAQLKKLTSDYGGMCILCAYDRHEREVDEVSMLKYRSNMTVSTPQKRPWQGVDEKAGLRQLDRSKAFLKFETTPGSEQGNASSTPSPEQVNESSEYDFCEDCDDQLNHEDMASGLCRSCRSVRSSSDRSSSYVKVHSANQNAPTESVPVTGTSTLAVRSTERVPVTDTSSLAACSIVAATSEISKMDVTPQETAVISTAAACPAIAATPEPSQMDDVPQVDKTSEFKVLASTIQNATEGSNETEDAESSYNEQIAKEYENAKKYPVNTEVISGIWACVRNEKLTSALTRPKEQGSDDDSEVSMDCNVSCHEHAGSNMGKAAPFASFGLFLKLQQIYFDQLQQAQYIASKYADAAPKCCNICQEPLEKHENITCEWCQGIPVCHCVERETTVPSSNICSHCVNCGDACRWATGVEGRGEYVAGELSIWTRSTIDHQN